MKQPNVDFVHEVDFLYYPKKDWVQKIKVIRGNDYNDVLNSILERICPENNNDLINDIEAEIKRVRLISFEKKKIKP